MTKQRKRNKPKTHVPVQFRPHTDGIGDLDEVFAENATVHIEQMGHDSFWMSLKAGGREYHLDFAVSETEIVDDEGKAVRPIILHAREV